MAESDAQDRIRHSKAFNAELITDPDELAAAEGRNGLRQIDHVVEMVEHFTQNGLAFKLRVSTLLHLHRYALEGISSYAGIFRPAGIEIAGSRHQPVDAFRVPEMIEEMCDYVNDQWATSTALHLAAWTKPLRGIPAAPPLTTSPELAPFP